MLLFRVPVLFSLALATLPDPTQETIARSLPFETFVLAAHYPCQYDCLMLLPLDSHKYHTYAYAAELETYIWDTIRIAY